MFTESDVGKDIFKVIVSIFGMTNETGDIIATATGDGHSKVKFFGVSSDNLTSSQNSSAQTERVLTFAAGFPGVVVNTGDSYKACVITLNDIVPNCSSGYLRLKRNLFSDF